jgi:hypothetical protein
MGFIRTILYLLIVFVLVVGGYWFYATKTGSADEIWANINAYMFEPLKSWSCGEIAKGAPADAPKPPTC